MYAPELTCKLPDRFEDNLRLSTKSIQALEELFAEMRRLKPMTDEPGNEYREVWLCVERGPIEAFGDFEQLKSWGDYDSYQDFEEDWRFYYPYEKCWYNLSVNEYQSSRSLMLGERSGFQTDVSRPADWEDDGYAEWFGALKALVADVIEKIRCGEYLKELESLPPEHRTGTVLRKDLYACCPWMRKNYYQDITEEEVQRFLREYARDGLRERGYEPQMTARRFYEACAAGYRALHFEGWDTLAPKELYRRHADGRDEGLTELPDDDAEAYAGWEKRGSRGGHPWEVCRGGNSTHISLYVCNCANHDDVKPGASGYFFALDGNSWARSAETIRFYLALLDAGFPVRMFDAEQMAARAAETDLLGIVPQGVIPKYCYGRFDYDKRVFDFLNLPDDEKYEPGMKERLLDRIQWRPQYIPELA